MTLLALLIPILLQRYLQFLSEPYRFDWMGHYYNWMANKIEYVTKGHGLLGLAILIVPILLVAAFVFAMAFHLMGMLGYLIVAIAAVWYCIDARDLSKQPLAAGTPVQTLETTYRSLYGIIFWFAVWGPVGLVLYYSAHYFQRYLLDRQDAESKELEAYAQKVLAALDWIPVRLFTFTFALVGHFGSVFKEWLRVLKGGLDVRLSIITECAKPIVTSQQEAISLLNRTLIVWLVVVALVTAGMLVGS